MLSCLALFLIDSENYLLAHIEEKKKENPKEEEEEEDMYFTRTVKRMSIEKHDSNSVDNQSYKSH